MARSRVYLPLRRDGLLTLQAGALPAGAEVIANVSASPFRIGVQATRREMLATRSSDSAARR